MLCIMCPWAVIIRQTTRHQGKRASTSTWDKVKHSRPIEKLNMERGGMGVFLLKFAERTRALDWHWYISGQLDYRLPKRIDVRIPALAQTVRLAIPEEAASSAVNAESTVSALWDVVLSNTSHREILRDLGAVPRIELAWKGPDATLDWVAYETTVTGRKREWALLASFAQSLQAGKHALLQARAAKHRAIQVVLEDKTKMEEPPSVEGYLTWYRGAGGPKELVYALSSEGVVFMAPASAATPPLVPKREGSMPADLFPDLYRSWIRSEHLRMTRFIEKCTGCIDLRDIAEVKLRRPPELPRTQTQALAAEPGNDTSPPTTPGTDQAQAHEHISTHKVIPKSGDKKDREFTVHFRKGHVVTFEAHSPQIAAEWVHRLSQLVQYWTLYHRVIARRDMDARQYHAKAWVNYGTDTIAEDILDNIWNWCVIDGCRPITAGGRIFVKRGKFRKFK